MTEQIEDLADTSCMNGISSAETSKSYLCEYSSRCPLYSRYKKECMGSKECLGKYEYRRREELKGIGACDSSTISRVQMWGDL